MAVPPPTSKIIAGVLPVVLVDESEAERRQALVDSLIIDELAIDLVSSYMRIDMTGLSANEPLPSLPYDLDFDGIRTELELIKRYDPTLTIRELECRLVSSSNTWLVIGTAEQVAEQLSQLYEAGAVDGYNSMFPLLPNDFDRFTQRVVPLLQARGVFRTHYEPGTLRDRLGLKRPPNSF